ncbi:hypothetical protein F6455_10645 [Proteobacteria bacterium 005FR1]|nr:hypothetical protein [Proteobacteria bacterium 005FR1]
MKKLWLSGLVAFYVWQSLAYADDTDIYLRPASDPAAPHLMITFDYRNDMAAEFCSASGNNSCQNLLASEPELLAALEGIVGVGNKASNIHAVMAVFQVVFSKFEGIYVGLMGPNKHNGGTILRGFKEFQEGDANGAKAELIGILKSLPVDGTGSGSFHEVSPKEMHYEFWRYLNGMPVALGWDTAGNFPDGIDTTVANHLKDPPDPYYVDSTVINKAGDSSVSNDSYVSPFSNPNVNYACTKLYSVYATSGNSGNDDGDLDAFISVDMSDGLSPPATDPNFDGMVRYLANNDLVNDSLADGKQSLKTWFIQMGSSATRTDDWARLMGTADQQNYMTVGGNNVSLADVQKALESAFIEALSVSTTFVSASVPVNVFNRIQTLDNFYIALFEASSTQRWPGNVKKLRLVDTDSPADGNYDDIVDTNGLSAFSDSDGRIRFEALTYWTDPATLPAADPDRGEIDGRDGRAVSRGGAGQKIPGFVTDDVGLATVAGARQVYVEPATAPVNGSAVAFQEFDADSTTADELKDLLGAEGATDADRVSAAEKLIAWARGKDVDDEDGDGATSDTRPWILGDAIHSRPLALNYGATSGYSQENPNIRLFMGTNDGFFHIIEDTASDGSQSGKELFAFIPRESLDVIKPLRQNDGGSSHPYGVDGEPVALVADDDKDGTIESGEEVYVYVGMRRGGKSYYALDVSSPSATPTLKWKITKTSGGDFDELGYTFSTPRVVKVQYDGTPRDALIFAGGYDLKKDTDTGSGRDADDEGNAIYIVDARTGELIWKAKDGSGTNTNQVHYHGALDHSIPSAVATLDSNANGIVDRAYVGDTSGIVWRIDLPEGNDTNHRRDQWEINKFADVDDSLEAEDRRFFHPPDIVQTKDSSGQYDGILIESGDRASPLETTDVNYMFLFKDRNTQSGNPPTTIIDDDNLPDTTACVTGAETGCSLLDYSQGWKVELAGAGEKGLASPITVDGKVFFTSYQPANLLDSCQPREGTGHLYVVNLKDGTAAYGERYIQIGPGIPPQVTAIGDDTLIIPGTGILDPFDTSGSLERSKLLQTGGKSMYIIYWREPGVDDL